MTFNFCKTFLINIVDLVILYIHTFVTISTNTHHGLDASSFVTKRTTNNHTDTMIIILGSVIKTTTPIFLIHEIDRVKSFMHYVHAAKILIRSSLGDLNYRMLFSKFVMDNTSRINEYSTRISVLIHNIEDICVAVQRKIFIKLWFYHFLLLTSSNNFVSHPLDQLVLITVSITIIRGGRQTNHPHIPVFCLIVELERIRKHDGITLVDNNNTPFVFWDLVNTNHMMKTLSRFRISCRSERPKVLTLFLISFLETLIGENNIDLLFLNT